MSYCTKVRISYYRGKDAVTDEMLVAAAKAILDDLNVYDDDVYEDLAFGFERGYTEFQDLRADHFTELFKAISRRFPTLTLCIWGHGEHPRDVWTREIRDGEVSFQRGPYHYADQIYYSPSWELMAHSYIQIYWRGSFDDIRTLQDELDGILGNRGEVQGHAPSSKVWAEDGWQIDVWVHLARVPASLLEELIAFLRARNPAPGARLVVVEHKSREYRL